MPVDLPPECIELESLSRIAREQGTVEDLAVVEVDSIRLPITSVLLGCSDPRAPLFIVVGGVHGLERIGARVVLSYLRTVLESFAWDETLRRKLEHTRLLFVPVVNPGGIALRQRSNPNGVDLMRNAPIPDSGGATPLIGGHRLSPALPWFRGGVPGQVEVETQALIDVVERHAFTCPTVVAIDVHSGFGFRDRLWFPYAHTRVPIDHLAEVGRIAELFDVTHPEHFYRIEPQAQAYTISGDVWDYLYDGYRDAQPEGSFVPLTLEMGSWQWVKKNPRQLISRVGPFNPQMPHREQRIRRRHFTLFDFLWRCVASPRAWAERSAEQRAEARWRAFDRWYAR
ncbi:MAG: DUF2817 domain-containing protein [Myxococcota bacterium]